MRLIMKLLLVGVLGFAVGTLSGGWDTMRKNTAERAAPQMAPASTGPVLGRDRGTAPPFIKLASSGDRI
jgi:hypothetical protein